MPEPQQCEIPAVSATYTTAHGSLTHWSSPGIEPATSWFLVRFVNHCTTTGTPAISFFNFQFHSFRNRGWGTEGHRKGWMRGWGEDCYWARSRSLASHPNPQGTHRSFSSWSREAEPGSLLELASYQATRVPTEHCPKLWSCQLGALPLSTRGWQSLPVHGCLASASWQTPNPRGSVTIGPQAGVSRASDSSARKWWSKLLVVFNVVQNAKFSGPIPDLELGPAICFNKTSKVTMMQADMWEPLIATNWDGGGGSHVPRLVAKLLRMVQHFPQSLEWGRWKPHVLWGPWRPSSGIPLSNPGRCWWGRSPKEVWADGRSRGERAWGRAADALPPSTHTWPKGCSLRGMGWRTDWPCTQELIRVIPFYLIHQLLARGWLSSAQGCCASAHQLGLYGIRLGIHKGIWWNPCCQGAASDAHQDARPSSTGISLQIRKFLGHLLLSLLKQKLFPRNPSVYSLPIELARVEFVTLLWIS